MQAVRQTDKDSVFFWLVLMQMNWAAVWNVPQKNTILQFAQECVSLTVKCLKVIYFRTKGWNYFTYRCEIEGGKYFEKHRDVFSLRRFEEWCLRVNDSVDFVRIRGPKLLKIFIFSIIWTESWKFDLRVWCVWGMFLIISLQILEKVCFTRSYPVSLSRYLGLTLLVRYWGTETFFYLITNRIIFLLL